MSSNNEVRRRLCSYVLPVECEDTNAMRLPGEIRVELFSPIGAHVVAPKWATTETVEEYLPAGVRLDVGSPPGETSDDSELCYVIVLPDGWFPTHRIDIEGDDDLPIFVQEIDGALYTAAEAESYDPADWELDASGALSFQGRPAVEAWAEVELTKIPPAG